MTHRWIGALWSVSLLLVWALARNPTPVAEATGPTLAVSTCPTRPSPAEPRSGVLALAARFGPTSGGTTESSPTDPSSMGAAVAKRGLPDGAAVSARLMDRIEARLAEGASGHIALLEELSVDFETASKVVEREMRDLSDRDKMRAGHAWTVFALSHETELIALSETFWRSLADDPDALSKVHPDIIELMIEGGAFGLAATASDATLDTFRNHAEVFSSHPEESLPEGVRSRRHRAERALSLWLTPDSSQQTVERIINGDYAPSALDGMLGQVRREDAQTNGSLLPVIFEGDPEAGIRFMYRHRIEPGPAGWARLDRAMLDADATRAYAIARYAEAGGRDWADLEPFLRAGLDGPRSAEFVAAIASVRSTPSQFAAFVLDRYSPDDPRVIAQLTRLAGAH